MVAPELAAAGHGATAIRDRAPAMVRLTQRRVYILPTRAGLLFGATLVTMLLGCINYNLGLGFVLTFLLAGTGVLGVLHTYRNLAHLCLHGGTVEPVFAGADAVFQVVLENPGRQPRYSVELSCEGGSGACVDIPAAAQVAARICLPTARRGWLALPRARVSTTFPLGFFRAWALPPLALRCLVYPRPAPGPVPLPEPAHGSGQARPAERGEDDFRALRAYQPGDSLRQVAWRTEARAQPLMTKEFSGQAGGEIWLDWKSTDPGLDAEARIARLARQVIDADARGLAAGLRLPGQELAPGLGPAHVAALLGALALLEAR